MSGAISQYPAPVSDSESDSEPNESKFAISVQQADHTEQGFKTLWNRLQQAWAKAGHARFTFHDLLARATSKLKTQGRQAQEITGHRTEAPAERVYDRRKIRSGKAVE
ncbi:MAG: hypothetical protein HYU77_06310 [Betaproteobacteria bacterium]|nr:hypothetical protein [Betaproteobacteria bacterium]